MDIARVLLSAVGNNILDENLLSIRIEELKTIGLWIAVVMIMWLYNGKYENVVPLIGGLVSLS